MKISELKNIKIGRLKEMPISELESYVKQAAKIVNTKINKLYRAGAGITGAEKIAPDAYRYMEKTGGLLSVYNDYKYSDKLVKKSREELITEIKRAKHFLGMKSSSVKAARKIQKFRKQEAKLNYESGKSDGELSSLFKMFLLVKEEFPEVPSDDVMQAVMESGGDVDKARSNTKSYTSSWRNKINDAIRQATEATGFTSKWFNNDEEQLPFV